MKKILLAPLLLSSFLSTGSTQGSDKCSSINTMKDLLLCAIENHPDLIRGKGSLKQADSLEYQASQRPNPELNVKSVYGKNRGDSVIGNEFNLAHTFEIGGKRAARIGKANAEKEQISSEFMKTKEDVYISVLKTLYRIRQVHSEMKALDEALDTFSKLKRMYKSRPRLAPEQEVSLSVFQLAEGDYKLKKSNLENEEYALERSVETAIGREFPHKDSLLPERKQDWPEYSRDGEFKGSQIKLTQSELKNAQAEVELARSNSWPDLKIGPTIQSQTEGPHTYMTYGLNITLPIPVFQANEGGKAVAEAGFSRAEQNLDLRKKELNQEYKILQNQYQKSTKSLKESASLSEIERRHLAVDRQFARGVISTSLIIEAHRQMLDFTKTQNEQELMALEALLRLQVLHGTLFEGGIK